MTLRTNLQSRGPHHVVQLRNTVACLERGGVIAYPTEGVWGLGADPWNEAACQRILQLKRRPWQKGLILVASDFDQLSAFVDVPSVQAHEKALGTWPGPNTWIYPKHSLAPDWISGEHDSIAVRVSAHPVVRALCESFGGAVVSTSANPAGRDPAMSATQVRLYFGAQIDALMPGALGALNAPTTIRDLRSGHTLRG